MLKKDYVREIESVCAGGRLLVSMRVVEWLLLGIIANVCMCMYLYQQNLLGDSHCV